VHRHQPARRCALFGDRSPGPGGRRRAVSTIEMVSVDATALTPITSRRRALRRLLRNPIGLTGLIVVVLAVLAALLANWIAPFPPAQTNFPAASLQPPSLSHWFGTDELGRDQLSRVLFGLRVSLTVSVLSIALSFVVGVPLGLLAGFYRRVD